MRKPKQFVLWRMMLVVALTFVIFVLIQKRSPHGGDLIVLGNLALAPFLALGLDRAIFGWRFRAFWLGFVGAQCIYIALALAYHWETWNYFAERWGRPTTAAETSTALLIDSAIRFAVGILVAVIGGGLVGAIVAFLTRLRLSA